MIRYCPHCDERLTPSVYEGTTHLVCITCEYVAPSLTRRVPTATLRRPRSGGFSPVSRRLTAVRS